ncbi:GNAT family N-acetyltransferase [Streptomyces sp. W16]|uniref:GNAT family N-acetyltransferase n=1 Tax=Streptomyces sp. W16 TaxID=3076631 RepID=UPI00295BB219|nr:GNAT family N-acetyltransferase [Streptomyces sp. W16]MDV9175365.1 GNAT family N-acetyltransferase [Streptomyces sp. W16]
MDIAVCGAADVALLDQHIGSLGATSFHARRFARQERGESTYLVAWLDGRPVGHAELRWTGCDAREVRAARPGCLEIGGLGVWPEELRSRGIGTALIRAAEELAVERGITDVGVGVAKDNPRAAVLYARLGYAPLTDYYDRWSYETTDGRLRDWVDHCTFLVKELPSGPLDVK